MGIIWDRPCNVPPHELKTILASLARIETTLEKLMTDDAAVLAVVTDEEAQITALGVSVAALDGLAKALLADPARGTLQPNTLTALQAAQASLAALAATGAADVAADVPPAAPVPPAA